MKSIESEALAYIRDLLSGNSDGHGFDHSERVYRNAMKIAETEPGCDLQVVALAAILHDTDDYKLFSTVNNANARAFLDAHDVPPQTAERICVAINAVSFRKNGGRSRRRWKGKLYRMQTGWTRSERLGLAEHLPSADPTVGLWMPRSGIFMRSCFC